MTLRSPLHDLHVELGARMGSFAGYEMPLWYAEKTLAEHQHTRNEASLFDISHMGQASIGGDNPARSLERLVPTDLAALDDNKMHYCCLTNEQGGIIDDLIIAHLGKDYFVVLNAARKAHDLQHLRSHLDDAVVIEHDENALIALQGPMAVEVLNRFHPKICELDFMTISDFELSGVPCFVSRSGYTGEDGFEISMPAESAMKLAKVLLEQPEVKPAGLGARDSLRLEAGLRLYGQDMSEQTTPVEAGIQWTISKSRRANGARAGGFLGESVIFEQLANGVDRRFVGLRIESKAPARNGTEICLQDGQVIGQVTSGLISPTLKTPIAMGYIDRDFGKAGQSVCVSIRGKLNAAVVVRLPFVPHRYHYHVKLQSHT